MSEMTMAQCEQAAVLCSKLRTLRKLRELVASTHNLALCATDADDGVEGIQADIVISLRHAAPALDLIEKSIVLDLHELGIAT